MPPLAIPPPQIGTWGTPLRTPASHTWPVCQVAAYRWRVLAYGLSIHTYGHRLVMDRHLQGLFDGTTIDDNRPGIDTAFDRGCQVLGVPVHFHSDQRTQVVLSENQRTTPPRSIRTSRRGSLCDARLKGWGWLKKVFLMLVALDDGCRGPGSELGLVQFDSSDQSALRSSAADLGNPYQVAAFLDCGTIPSAMTLTSASRNCCSSPRTLDIRIFRGTITTQGKPTTPAAATARGLPSLGVG